MPPGLPHRPPLAMRLWLSRSFGRGSGTSSATAAAGRSLGRTMGIESLEHMMRSKVRLFLRHTWLVTIIGTIILGASVWAGFYYTTEGDRMRIAAGPRDAKFVQALSDQLTNPDEVTPLILDDVLVQSDTERKIAILRVLHLLSKDRQVILFTQEDNVFSWGEQNLVGADDRVERLQ